MEPPNKHSGFVSIAVAIIGAIGVMAAGFLSYRASIDAAQVPINATLTAEARITPTIASSATAQEVPTKIPVPHDTGGEEPLANDSAPASTLTAQTVVTNNQLIRPTLSTIGTEQPAAGRTPDTPTASASENQPFSIEGGEPPTQTILQSTTPTDIQTTKIHVTGTGMAPSYVTSPTQREALAITAAEVAAKAHIAEWLTGSEVEAVTIVSLGTLVTDTIKTRVRATVPPTTRVSEQYDPVTNVATVVLELQLPSNE